MMKRLLCVVTVGLSVSSIFSTTAFAEEPGQFDRPARTERGARRAPLFSALDADGDGELSSEEIGNATTALTTLDKDGNGALTREELMPEWIKQRENRSGEDGQRGRGQEGARQKGGGARGSRLLQLDQDGDGTLSADEIPERLQRLVDRFDENSDGALDASELESIGKGAGRGDGQHGKGFERQGRLQRQESAPESAPDATESDVIEV